MAHILTLYVGLPHLLPLPIVVFLNIRQIAVARGREWSLKRCLTEKKIIEVGLPETLVGGPAKNLINEVGRYKLLGSGGE